ncbi:DUF4235 domain-containing protein [Frankia sp. CcWB2]
MIREAKTIRGAKQAGRGKQGAGGPAWSSPRNERCGVAKAASKLGWKIVGGGATALAGMAASRVVSALYRKVRKSDPPANPADPDTAWTEAVAWAAISGLAIGIGRLAAERAAARGWARATGSPPPGMLHPKTSFSED